MKNHLLLRCLVAACGVVLIMSCASNGWAQSGRRVRKPEPVTVPTPEPEPSPTPNASAEKQKPRYTFLVGLDRREVFANLPMYAYEGALRSLIDRLDDSPVVHVGGSQGDMTRSDAIQKAKAEKEGYVILVSVQVDTMGSSQTSGTPDMVMEYSVFAPTTAKQLTFGRTYTQAQRNRGSILNPRPSSIYGDRYLNQAAQEAADRILAYFRSHGPVQPPPSKLP